MKYTLNIQKILLLAFLTLAFGIISSAKDKEGKKFTKKDLPTAVLSAFEKAYPKAEIIGVDKENENKTTYYEIESMDGKTKRDLLYTIDGKVFETEEMISADALPKAISDALNKDYKKSSIAKAEKITKGNDVKYEIQLESGNEKKMSEVVFDVNGKVIKAKKEIEEKDDDEEKEDEDEDDDEKNQFSEY